MITAFCANPCIDRTVEIDSFTYGGMNRIQNVREDGCGKGINVAVALRLLGLDAAVTGVMPNGRCELAENRLSEMDCRFSFVRNPGSVRVNTKVFDRSSGVITEINERGVPSSPEETQAAVDLAVSMAKQSSYMVLTGSVPAGMPADIYRQIAARIADETPACRVVLDAENELLKEGLAARPYLIKPNRYELELLCGEKLQDVAAVHRAARRVMAQWGLPLMAVSLGGDGAYMTDGKEAFFAPVHKVTVRSTVGAGDCMVAGLLLGLSRGLTLEETFRLGVAAATSSVTTEGTKLIDVEKFRELIPQILIEKVN